MSRSLTAAERILTLEEGDPNGGSDPLWYDCVEVDTPPGLVLNTAAYLFLWAVAGLMLLPRLYWLPDRLWCRVASHVQRRREMGDKRL